MSFTVGRSMPHAEMIDQSSLNQVGSRCGDFRYLLSYSFKREKKRTKALLVVMKNPSSASPKNADKTNRNLQEYVYRHFSDVKTIHVTNLFPIRAVEARDVFVSSEEGVMKESHLKRNDKVLQKLSLESDYLLFAWGGPNGIPKKFYSEQVKRILQVFGDRNCYRIKRGRVLGQYPRHAMIWGYQDVPERVRVSEIRESK